MLTIAQKADILRKNGIAVPAMPADDLRGWNADVDVLFVTYAAARAAKSLRDAEELRQLELLRRISALPSRHFQQVQGA
jgi:hypothetical protein